MNNEFEKGRLEFKQKNYEKALKHFEGIGRDDKNYEFSLLYRVSALIHLKRYREALSFLNRMIEDNPYEYLLWFDKARCHIFLDEDKNAYSSMETLERIVDTNNKEDLLHIAKLYSLLGDDEKTMEYADKALAIDENYKEALFEKSLVATSLKDDKMMGEISDKLYEVSDKDIFSLMPVFLLKLFSKDYRGCLDLANNCELGELDGESVDMVKSVLYKNLCEDLNAQLALSQEIDISVDDAIELMLDFKESGKDHGEFEGVHYFIL